MIGSTGILGPAAAAFTARGDEMIGVSRTGRAGSIGVDASDAHALAAALAGRSWDDALVYRPAVSDASLAFIRAASNVGLTIEEIREELGRLPGNRTPTKADWQRISRHWGRRLDEQIAALQRLKSGLDGCIGCGCLSLRSCAFSNPDDVHGERGPGARLLPDSLRRPHPTRRSPG